jgi:hypothetical protein
MIKALTILTIQAFLGLSAFAGSVSPSTAVYTPFTVTGVGHDYNCHSIYCSPDYFPPYTNGQEDAEMKANSVCTAIHANAQRISDWILSEPDTAKAQFICVPDHMAGSIVDGNGSVQTYAKDGCTNVDETIEARIRALDDAMLKCSHPHDGSHIKLISSWLVWKEAYPHRNNGMNGWTCISEATAKFECL